MRRGGPGPDIGPRGGRGDDGPGRGDRGRGGDDDGRRGGGQAPERFKMRQNIISFGDDYWIETMSGRRAFKVNGKAVRLVNTLILEDPRGMELLQIQAKVASVRNAMDIERPQGRGPVFATIKKDLVNVIRDEYKVNVAGKSDLEVKGNILDHEYRILDARTNREVAEVTKKWLALADTYTIQINAGSGDAEDFLILGICIAVEQMSHDSRLPAEGTPVGVHTVDHGDHMGGAVATAGVGAVAAAPVAGAAAVTMATGSVAAGVATVAVAQSIAPPPGPPPQQMQAPPPAAAQALPAGWVAQLDPPSGRYFFVMTTMNPPFVTWDDPRTVAIEQAPVMPPQPR